MRSWLLRRGCGSALLIFIILKISGNLGLFDRPSDWLRCTTVQYVIVT